MTGSTTWSGMSRIATWSMYRNFLNTKTHYMATWSLKNKEGETQKMYNFGRFTFVQRSMPRRKEGMAWQICHGWSQTREDTLLLRVAR